MFHRPRLRTYREIEGNSYVHLEDPPFLKALLQVDISCCSILGGCQPILKRLLAQLPFAFRTGILDLAWQQMGMARCRDGSLIGEARRQKKEHVLDLEILKPSIL